MVIADLDYKEYFSEEKIKEYSEIFNEADAENKGLLNVDQLGEAFSILGVKLTWTQLETIFNEYDVDGSETIDFEEFCVMMVKIMGVTPKVGLIQYADYLDPKTIDQLSDAFVKFDVRGEGGMNAPELNCLLKNLGLSLTKQKLLEVVKEVDTDGSGEIEFDEFCNLWVVLTQKSRRVNSREFLTSEQIELYMDSFKFFDQHKDGRMQLDAIGNCLRMLGQTIQREQLQKIMTDFDYDWTAGIDFNEFCVMMIKLRREKRKRKIEPSEGGIQELLDEGFSVLELKASGFKLEDLKKNISTKKLYEEGEYEALDFRLAGFDAGELRKAGIGAHELRRCGFSTAQLRQCGFSDACIHGINQNIYRKLINREQGVLAKTNPYMRVSLPKTHSAITPRILDHCNFVPKMSQGPIKGISSIDGITNASIAAARWKKKAWGSPKEQKNLNNAAVANASDLAAGGEKNT